MATLAVLTLFSIYVTWAAFQGENYYANPYLSPLYSPVLYTDPSVPGAAPLQASCKSARMPVAVISRGFQ